MSIFSIFIMFFGISTIIGVPLLSSFQVTQIKGSTYKDWVSGLPATFGPAVLIVIIISIIAFIVLKPLSRMIKEAEKRELSEDEKFNANKILQRLKIVSIISCIVGYPIGNGTTIIIKTLAGKVSYNATDISIIMVLIIFYALIAIEYCITGFSVVSSKQLAKLKIHSTENYKNKSMSMLLFNLIICISFTAIWHVFCSGYSAIRHGWSMDIFLKKAAIALCYGIFLTLPMLLIFVKSLKDRFNNTINQISSLRENGDLVSRLNISDFDDFGVVMTEMNKLMDFLKKSLENLKFENTKVDTDAGELLNITENSFSGITQIVKSFENMSAQNSEQDKLLENARINIEKLNEKASIVNQIMDAQSSSEKENALAIEDMVANLKAIASLIEKAQVLSKELNVESSTGKTEVEKSMVVINDISEKSKKMSDVIQVIDSVANQTNLLAMNAAIEAAHAGESGKGFAVVAGEIRKLAEDTQKSAKDISTIIEEIVNVIESGEQSMVDTQKAFGKIREKINVQSAAVNEISESIIRQSGKAGNVISNTKMITEKISEVSSLINSQTQYTLDIKNGIENIVNLAENINSAMKESESVVKEFSDSFKTVKEKAEQNRTSVLHITGELNKFKI